MRVGLVINPIAGMGGSVGLKGTDSQEVLEEAIRRGARPTAQARTIEALEAAEDLEGYDFVTAGGDMGENVLKGRTPHYQVVYRPAEATTDQDTIMACAAIVEANVELLLFTGGDGTARDVMDAVDQTVPVIGIPSGVKMHSGVFANTPRDAGRLLRRTWVEELRSRPAEVMDIDEDAVREGTISASLYGLMLTPEEPSLVQPFKLFLGGGDDDTHKEAIAKFYAEGMKPGVLYILGPGTTMEAVGARLGIDKTLLGVDLVVDGKLLGKDVDENTILQALDAFQEARIAVSPIGAQGFIFGRGNQQISHRVIGKVGIGNVDVLATPLKMQETRPLRVDTGDKVLDDELRGYIRVLVGYGKQMIVPVN